MVAYIIGVVVFALCIGASPALHEAGHLLSAKAFGMKVGRYFVGFGPKVFSFRRGETEYGLKAIPVGGFCEIAGMTALDDVDTRDEPRAIWRQKTWYEHVRNWLRDRRGKTAAAPVDYTKLSGITMVLIIVGGPVLLLTVTADIVNPIRITQ
ncbi:MAG: site-2 protease family protein [Pseudonocardiaceae bacterium]|nr:site-2 protease family protein [Pseudonocardiaceae bacterium]